MGWFRRTRSAPTIDESRSLVPVPVATAPALARTEHALKMLATQSAQLHTSIVQLEHRVDAMSETLRDQGDRPTHDDVVDARRHSAKVAAELSRLEINIAARIDAVRSEVRGAPAEIDLRQPTPTDTGF